MSMNSKHLPARKTLPHEIPFWVRPGAVFEITICTRPCGKNQLCHGQRAQELYDAILDAQCRGVWWAHLVLFMPDHAHMLVGFAAEPGMAASVRNWKGYVAKHHGIVWQRGFFDHRLRRYVESYEEKAAYIRCNPLRAGLVAPGGTWPYVWANPAW